MEYALNYTSRIKWLSDYYSDDIKNVFVSGIWSVIKACSTACNKLLFCSCKPQSFPLLSKSCVAASPGPSLFAVAFGHSGAFLCVLIPKGDIND